MFKQTLPRRYRADPFQAQMQNIAQRSSAQLNVPMVLERADAIQMNRRRRSFEWVCLCLSEAETLRYASMEAHKDKNMRACTDTHTDTHSHTS